MSEDLYDKVKHFCFAKYTEDTGSPGFVYNKLAGGTYIIGTDGVRLVGFRLSNSNAEYDISKHPLEKEINKIIDDIFDESKYHLTDMKVDSCTKIDVAKVAESCFKKCDYCHGDDDEDCDCKDGIRQDRSIDYKIEDMIFDPCLLHSIISVAPIGSDITLYPGGRISSVIKKNEFFAVLMARRA